MYQYEYPRPSVTVDVLVFEKEEKNWKLLLIKRKNPPFQHQWAIPGGFVDENESVEHAAERELEEETGLKNIPLAQLHTFSTPYRDPRTWVISIAHIAVVPEGFHAKAADDAEDAKWFTVSLNEEVLILDAEDCHIEYHQNELISNDALAFDHMEMVKMAMNRIGEYDGTLK